MSPVKTRQTRFRRPRFESLEVREMLSAAPVLDYGFSFGGERDDGAYNITSDSAGNVYVAGTFSDAVDVDPGPGVHQFSTPNLDQTDAFVAKYSPAGQLVWAYQAGVNGTAAFTGISVDSMGNTFAVGGFDGELPGGAVSSGGGDALLVKLNSDGTLAWLNRYASTEYDTADYVAADDSGNVFFAGSYNGTIDFDFGAGTTERFGQVVAKADSDGNLLWAHEFQEGPVTIAADAAGGLLFAASFNGTFDADPGPDVVELNHAGSGFSSGFVLRLDASGDFDWVRQLTATSSASLYGIVVDSANNIFVSGEFQGVADFDPGPGLLEVDGSGAFVWKLTIGGDVVWAKAIEGNAYTYRIATDSLGAVYVTGGLYGPADMDPGSESYVLGDSSSSDGFTTFAVKLNAAGNFEWAQSWGGDGEFVQLTEGVAVDSTGRVYLGGYFADSVDFDPGLQANVLTSQGAGDVVILRLLPTTLIVAPDPATVSNDLQNAVTVLQSSPNVQESQVSVSATSEQIASVVQAINQVTSVAGGSTVEIVAEVPVTTDAALDTVILAANAAAPNTNGLEVEIVVNLASGNYSIGTIDLAPGVRLVLNGFFGGSITFVGSSPALIVNSGEVVATGVTFENSTDASTILVNGGRLILRDSVVRETPGGSHAAIEIHSGHADLGTIDSPGGNTFSIDGPGDYVKNLSQTAIAAIGNSFEMGDLTIAADVLIEPRTRLYFDEIAGNLATAPKLTDVQIDILAPTMNVGQNGAISLVIFGSSLFDVTSIDTDSLKLAGVSMDVQRATLNDHNQDGEADILLHFHMSDTLRAALSDIYADLLMEDYADDEQFAPKQDAILSLDGAFGELGEAFRGEDSANLFLAGKSLKTLLASLGIA